MDTATLQTSIASTKTLITAYEAAVLALVTGGVESYTLDTGQSRQTVTKLDINNLNKALDTLYNRCATLEARLTGSGSTTARPGW